MRRYLAIVVLLVVLFSGCSEKDSHLSPAIRFRSELVQSGGCSFEAEITADYGTEIQQFRLLCDADAQGNVRCTILEPETLEGICAVVTEQGGKIVYEGLSVDFGYLADGTIAPAAAPAILLNSWLSGYILWGGEQEAIYQATYEEEIKGSFVKVESFFKNNLPFSAEVCYNGKRVLEMKITAFQFH